MTKNRFLLTAFSLSLCPLPLCLLLQLPCTESHRCMMSERHCPRRQYLPVKAQVSQWWWTEANLSTSPTNQPHSHTWPLSSGCVKRWNVTKAERFSPTRLQMRFFSPSGLHPGEPLFLYSPAPPLPTLFLQISRCRWMYSGVAEFIQHRREADLW